MCGKIARVIRERNVGEIHGKKQFGATLILQSWKNSE